MESTGVYWVPLCEILEQHGFRCCLINAASSKRFPGRKSDVLDCQWWQTWHSQAAAALIRSDSVFGAFYRRVKGRLGPAQALIATAHKLARVVYKLLKDKVPYTHTTAQEEAARFRDREIAYLRRKAAKLGLTLTEPEVSLVS